MNRKNSSPRGFTLVELMVSLTVFSIVMTISVGTLLVLIDLNAKAQALYSATTNLSFALDSMTREMRTGYRYYCKQSSQAGGETLPGTDPDDVLDCTGGNYISFIREEDDERMGYRLNTTSGSLEQKVASGNWVAITAEEVVVSSFEVTVANSETLISGSGPERLAQPSVDVTVQGYVNNGLDTDTDFHIQTHILQRRLDII